jgi:hypothetical protein
VEGEFDCGGWACSAEFMGSDSCFALVADGLDSAGREGDVRKGVQIAVLGRSEFAFRYSVDEEFDCVDVVGNDVDGLDGLGAVGLGERVAPVWMSGFSFCITRSTK